ncbi:MAG: hypothetical protein JO235_09810 [Chroococcidiopsidaceae cyanobacterium CP_BM_RX_35]|nr:hypothetical protein [Chroococcidiopsidaceae cyanobacterium CP_BM_RX_35]
MVRTRMPGGVGGGNCEVSPYPDLLIILWQLIYMTEGKKAKKSLKLLSFGIAPHDGWFCIGVSPHGLISIGAIPHGLISIGLVPMGVISIGLVSMGLLSIGSISMGLIGAGQMSMSLVQLNAKKVAPQEQPGANPDMHHNMSH